MKHSNRILKKGSITVLLLLLAFNSHGQKTCSPVDFKQTGEDVIKTSLFIKDHKDIQEEFNRFKKKFKCDEKFDIKNIPLKIDMSALVKLFTDFSNSFIKPTDTSYISGLQIYFGLKDKNLVYLFRPLIMKRGEKGDDGRFEYKISQKDIFYSYNAGVFSKATTQLVDTMEYETNIRIKHLKTSLFYRKIISNDDGHWKNDAKSAIFSFQEIFGLCEGFPKQQALYVYSSAALFKYYNGASKHRLVHRNKHTIFIALTDDIKNNQASIANFAPPTIDQAANLAHLCPPNCSAVYYEREK
jgi:hypothetical protein